MLTHLDCTKCEKRYEPGRVYTVCACGAPRSRATTSPVPLLDMRPGHLALREPTMWRYREVLPLAEGEEWVSLGEGLTPLLPAPRLGARLGLPRLTVKEEGGNPTGSFKARGLSVAVSMAKALGATDVCLPSAGNAGGALAAYAAAPASTPTSSCRRTSPGSSYGDRGLRRPRRAGRRPHHRRGPARAAQAKEHGWYDVATLKEPYRVEGKKTMGYEIAEQMGWHLPDAILYPTGGGTGLVGMWKAFAEMETMGCDRREAAAHVAVQAEGCAPIVKAFPEGREDAPYWENAPTHAPGLRVPKALADFLILRGIRESHGGGDRRLRAGDRRRREKARRARASSWRPRGGARRRRPQAEGLGPPLPRRRRRPLRHRHRLQYGSRTWRRCGVIVEGVGLTTLLKPPNPGLRTVGDRLRGRLRLRGASGGRVVSVWS